MRPKLQNFFDRFRIKNKIIVACLPFVILSYVILFLSITLIMYQQMRTMVYDQTRQNIIEKPICWIHYSTITTRSPPIIYIIPVISRNI